MELDGSQGNISATNNDGAVEAEQQLPNNILFSCINRVFGFGPGSPKEATGLSLDIVGRATVAMSSTLLGPALLQLASDAAGCPADSGADCENKIYGMRPSSLMTNIAAISGVIVCVMLPLFGSIIDHTKYRRQVGIYTAILVTLLKAIEISVGPKTWFWIAIMQIFLVFLYNIHLTTAYAYISELSSDPQKLSRYNSSFYTTLYVATVLFLVVVIGIGMVWDVDDVGTARISQTLVTLILIVCWSIAWKFYFPDRPAASQVPEGMTVLNAGFRKLYRTIRTITANNTALLCFLISVSFSEAASFALITVSTTYMKTFLKMDATQIGYVILIVLLAGIPGAIAGNIMTKYTITPLPSVLTCDVLFIVSTVLASVILNGPERKNMAYIFAILWGLGLGWLHPQHIAVYGALIPNGQEAELMGIFLFFTYVIGWLPPLVFSALNEGGINMAWGLASLAFFFLIAIIFLLLMIMLRKTWMVSTMENLSGGKKADPSEAEMQELQQKASDSGSENA